MQAGEPVRYVGMLPDIETASRRVQIITVTNSVLQSCAVQSDNIQKHGWLADTKASLAVECMFSCFQRCNQMHK